MGLKILHQCRGGFSDPGASGKRCPSVELGMLVLAVVEEVKLLIPHSKSPASRFLFKVKSGIISTIRLHLLVAGGAFDSDHAR